MSLDQHTYAEAPPRVLHGLWLRIATEIDAGAHTTGDLRRAMHGAPDSVVKKAVHAMIQAGLIRWDAGAITLTDKALGQMPGAETER